MNTYDIHVSPRVEREIQESRSFQQEVLEAVCRFLRGDWGSVTERMQQDNDEIFLTNQPTRPSYSIFGILREPVYEIFACYRTENKGVIWIIRDVRCENGAVPQLAVLHPLEYGHWNGPYIIPAAAV